MFTQEVNVDAMYRATTLLFSDQAAMMLAKLADTIDRAQQDAYAVGLAEGQENLEAACDASFDAGWQNAEEQCKAEAVVDANEIGCEAFDDGYLQGVQDARASPELADVMVQEILFERAEPYFEALEDAGFDDVFECSICGKGPCEDEFAC